MRPHLIIMSVVCGVEIRDSVLRITMESGSTFVLTVESPDVTFCVDSRLVGRRVCSYEHYSDVDVRMGTRELVVRFQGDEECWHATAMVRESDAYVAATIRPGSDFEEEDDEVVDVEF